MTPDFEERLAREIMRSERTRMAILAALLGALIVILSVFAVVFKEHVDSFFAKPRPVGFVIAVCALLLAYELLARRRLGRRLDSGKGLARALQFWNALVETSMPTALILVVSRDVDPAFALQSAAGYLYAVFIVLSTLSLDFRLSVFTGIVAAVEYVALSAVFVPGSEVAAGTPFMEPPFYVTKGIMLVLTGFAAGFVAREIKWRVIGVFRSFEERQRVVAAFGQQVSPEIVEELLRQGGRLESKRTYVCVLFMDIRGFTRLVQHRSPEEIVAYQNAVFGAAVEIVNRHHGVINQFLGDGFMATFGAPVATGRESANALGAARELLVAVKALSDVGRIPAMSIGIGLHAGEAVSGNIGSEARKQYSVSGDVVILASRIEQLNKVYGSQLLASAEVLRDAAEAPAASASLGPVKVRGRDEPIEIYRLA